MAFALVDDIAFFESHIGLPPCRKSDAWQDGEKVLQPQNCFFNNLLVNQIEERNVQNFQKLRDARGEQLFARTQRGKTAVPTGHAF